MVELGKRIRYSFELPAGKLENRSPIPGKLADFLFSRLYLELTQPYWVSSGGFSAVVKPPGLGVTTHLHLASRLRKSCAVTLLPTSSMACTGTTPFLPLISHVYLKKIYRGCPRRNVPDFGRVFIMLKYTDITQNTYVQSWTVTQIMAREFETLMAVTHLLITKYILKLAGICGFCNVNICT